MAWEVDKQKRTLFIEKYSRGGVTYYSVYPQCRVTTSTGTTYLEPIPFDMVWGSKDAWMFNAVEFIDTPWPDRADVRGDLGLTNVREDGVQRGA